MGRRPKNVEVKTFSTEEDCIIQKEFIDLIDERFTNYAFAVMEDRRSKEGTLCQHS